MSRWTHAVCPPCYDHLHPGRDPVALRPEVRELESCCRCGKDTNAGIYVRHDPDYMRCQGTGPVHEEAA